MKPIDFERYLVGEAPPEVVAAVEARIAGDPEFAEQVRSRRAEREAFALDPRRRRFADLVEEAERSALRPWSGRSGRRTVLGVGLAVACAAGVLLLAPLEGLDHRGFRVKGGISVRVAVAGSDGVIARYEPGQVLHPGDRLRLSIDDPVGGFVTVLLEENVGKVDTVYRAKELGRLSPGQHELPGSLELDGRLGRERLYVLLSAEPPDEASWQMQITAAQESSGFDHGWLPAAPTRVHTIDYEKVPR